MGYSRKFYFLSTAAVILLGAAVWALSDFYNVRFNFAVRRNYNALRIGMNAKDVRWSVPPDGVIFCRGDRSQILISEWPEYSSGRRQIPIECQEMKTMFVGGRNYIGGYRIEFDNKWILSSIEPLRFGPFAP